MGTTTIELAKTYGCQITAVDLDKAALAQAKLNGDKAGVSELVTFEQANAMKLPYDDNSFDLELIYYNPTSIRNMDDNDPVIVKLGERLKFEY